MLCGALVMEMQHLGAKTRDIGFRDNGGSTSAPEGQRHSAGFALGSNVATLGSGHQGGMTERRCRSSVVAFETMQESLDDSSTRAWAPGLRRYESGDIVFRQFFM